MHDIRQVDGSVKQPFYGYTPRNVIVNEIWRAESDDGTDEMAEQSSFVELGRAGLASFQQVAAPLQQQDFSDSLRLVSFQLRTQVRQEAQ